MDIISFDTLQLLPVAVYLTDPAGRITFTNNAALKLFGYGVDELNNGANILQFLEISHREKAMANMRRTLEGGESLPIEYMGIKKDSSTMAIIVQSQPLYINEKFIGFVGIIIEKTDQNDDNILKRFSKNFGVRAKNFESYLTPDATPSIPSEIPGNPSDPALKQRTNKNNHPLWLDDSPPILVMDDEAVIRQLAINFLIEMGALAVGAENGEAALALLKKAQRTKNPFRLVLMDLTIIGGMGGVETIKAMKDADISVPAIAASGYCDDPVMRDPQKYGFIDKIAKPWLKNDFQELVFAICKRK